MQYHVKKHTNASQRRAMAQIQAMEINPFVKINTMAESFTSARDENQGRRSTQTNTVYFDNSSNNDQHDFTN